MILHRLVSIFLVLGGTLVGFSIGISNEISEPETCSLVESMNKILNITATITAEIEATNFAENIPLIREYDFVIVGAGPSGCVLANRLTEANYSVLLLEAGTAENPILTNIPMSASNLQLSNYNWNYATEAQDKACLCRLC